MPPQPLARPTLIKLLEHSAGLNPEAIALLAPERLPLTYRQLLLQCQEVEAFLHTNGLGRSARVALVLPNGPEMALAFLSFGSYLTTAPLNPSYREAEFDFYLEDLQASALVVLEGSDSPALAVAQKRQIPVLTLTPRGDEGAGRFQLSGALALPPTPQEPAQPDDIALVLHTSGTTSRPKIVPLTQANLCHSAQNIAQTLQLTPQDRCLNVMPLFHIHGLIAAVLSSLTAGGSVVCTPGFYAPQFFPWLTEFTPSWYTAVPTMHQAILARAQGPVAHHSLRFIRSASSALPPQVMAELESVFQVPALEAYGMTEGSHQLASNPLPPAVRKPGSVGIAAGPEVAVMDDSGELLPQGSVGELVVRGANVTPGYENNPSANASSFTQGWFRTGDQGYIDPEGYVFLTGRLKEIINRGGEKIAPREIEEALLNHPDVTQAVSFAIPHARLGETVGAAVILREGRELSSETLRLFLTDTLADFKLPESILFLTEFPKGATGKLQRIGMAERLGVEPLQESIPTERVAYVAPQTPQQEQLVALWEAVLRVSPIGIHDHFFQLGGDSMLATQLLSRVRSLLAVEVRFVEFFQNPTVQGLSEQIAVSRGRHTTLLPLVAHSRHNAPLSLGQKALWFLSQLDPMSRAYHQTHVLRLDGPLKVRALERALVALGERHEALRTTISLVEGEPTQTILPTQPLVLTVHTIQEDELEACLTRFTQPLYDLDTGPLWRTQLLQVESGTLSDRHYLLFGMHHIVFDDGSKKILYEELLRLYATFEADLNQDSPLAPLPIQYADFTLWQQQWLQGTSRDEQLQYWVQQLADLPLLQLETDHPRPPLLTERGATLGSRLSVPLTQALKDLSTKNNSTLFMTLLAALSALLSHYSGQEDIPLGISIANRNQAELESMIGLLTNTLVIRTDLSGRPSFQALLERVRQRTLEAYTYQDLPFSTLVEVLVPERDMSRSPLVQVMLIQHHPPLKGCTCGELTVSDHEVARDTTDMDLNLFFQETPTGLEFQWNFNTDLFDSSTITRMQRHWETLLEAIVQAPDAPLLSLEILPTEEKQQLLVDFNATKMEIPQQCLHELIEQQVGKTPNAIALVFEDQSLTYSQLDQRANQLAHRLQSLGAGADTLVGISLKRSVEMVVALLATLKAGAAYVPIDPEYPEDRRQTIAEEARVVALITHDPDWSANETFSTLKPQVTVQPENLAYVIYTSGSTGTPKGAMNSHQGIVSHLLWMEAALKLTAADRILQKTPYGFDVSVWEFFLPLMIGATLVVAPPDLHRDAPGLIALIQKEAITTVHFVPSMLQIFLEEHTHRQCTTLKRVLCSGEALPPSVVQLFHQSLTAELHNLYGPTEAAVDVTHWPCLPNASPDVVPIGKPLWNTQLYVLNAQQRLVPLGKSGELYIGGTQLARGYLNRPELTAECFIDNPFGEGKLYKTGDLAKWLPDGNLLYLGRLDHQVKIRGIRIELAEIDVALERHPQVQQCVVVAHKDAITERHLVAYLVASKPIPVLELRAFLTKTLPDYMVPQRFIFLESFPLNPNGKVDRKALPAPERAPQELGSSLAPETPEEKRLAELWCQFLGTKQVGRHDNFFELGGHSFLAMRLFKAIEETFGVRIPLATLFQSPTLSQLAALLHPQTELSQSWRSLVAIQPNGARPAFFCVHAIGANLLNYRLLAQHLGQDQPFYGLQSQGLDGLQPPHSSVEEMAAHYLTELRTVQPHGPYRLGGGSAGGTIAFEMARQLQQQGEKIALLVFLDTAYPAQRTTPLPLLKRLDRRLGPLLLGKREHASRPKKATPPTSNAPLSPTIRTVTETNQAALRSYKPQPYPGPITQLMTANPVHRSVDDPRLVWGQLTSFGLEIHPIEGNHTNMLNEPHIQNVAAVLRRCLDRVLEPR
ncbi:amino acid adenylation domain-containing protein [Armatimonas rosea]|uniref:Amino acid adenylation domain-containing protein n=1 Tax=Armatimonas rosea TaxID=685828 RepID=A0A7W9W599_ARMRO|nr:amino acid adenylation domain-containing protein [Armatimonas rosea]